MMLLVPANSLIKQNRPAAMPTTSFLLAVMSRIWVMQSAGAVFVHVCVSGCIVCFLWQRLSASALLHPRGLKPHVSIQIDSKSPVAFHHLF